MRSILQTLLKSLGAGVCLVLLQRSFETTYLTDYLRVNLITILFGLLAINAATLGVVLTKLRDLMGKSDGKVRFLRTRKEMLLSIREQVGLVFAAILLLIVEKSTLVISRPNLSDLVELLLSACLIYALIVLYDTSKSVFVVMDYPD